MQGREGSERYPQSGEVPLDAAVLRSLRALDSSLTMAWVQDITALYSEPEVLRARNATLLAKPADVKAFFASQFRKIVVAQPVPRQRAANIRTVPDDDPYAF
jgi:hypothetical protein